MNNYKITTAAFAATHPYKDERRAFERLFPNGTTWSELVERAATGYQPAQDILCWWASSAPPDAANFAERIAAMRLCETPEVSIAQNCPADVPGADLNARLAVQRTPGERAYFGAMCSGRVPGATLEARLAVQEDADGRAWVEEYWA